MEKDIKIEELTNDQIDAFFEYTDTDYKAILSMLEEGSEEEK